ncbi:MAG: hypothetical protein H6974_02275 [Gammaproteobacteria bacterium]|nr:hypothetical protein [Gammaproteobacteria bacterium]
MEAPADQFGLNLISRRTVEIRNLREQNQVYTVLASSPLFAAAPWSADSA